VVALLWTVWALEDGKNLGTGDQAGVLGIPAAALGVFLSAASLVVAWLGYRADRRESATAAGTAAIVDGFAVAVRGEWEAEAGLRRLNDPYALPVSWTAAEEELAEPWGELIARPDARVGSVSGPTDLAGRDDEIGNLFQVRLPIRRLVILGEPGSGKSMLLVRLLLDLCARRSSGDPVPVLFSLSSWDPAADDLGAWLEQQLRTHHPALAAEYDRSTQARALLEHRLVLPLLDGFDEMAPAAQAVALDAINRGLPAGHPFVLSSRTAEYRRALVPDTGVPVRLNGAAAIVLQPLGPDTTAAYLVRDAGGSHGTSAARWSPVLARLGTHSPVGEALDTPLTLFLARTIYNPRPGESNGGLPDPGELCDERRFPDADAVRTHLFAAYIPAAYRPRPQKPCRWTPDQAQKYLSFLAERLQARGGGTDIAWWSLASGLPRGMMTLLQVAVTAAVWGLVEVPLGTALVSLDHSGQRIEDLVVLLFIFLLSPVAVLLARIGRRGFPAVKLPWRPNRVSVGCTVIAGCVVGLLGAMVSVTVVAPSALISLVLTATLTGWRVAPTDLAAKTSPARVLREDRKALRTFATRMTLYSLLGWPLLFFLATAANALSQSSDYDERHLLDQFSVASVGGLAVWGLIMGIMLMVAIILGRAASASWFLARHYYAVRRLLPRDLLAFLQDAHENRSVLRQVGAVYQFRHLHLQHQLGTGREEIDSSRQASAAGQASR
jgi:NACHT domain